MRVTTVVWLGLTGVLGFKVQVLMAAVAAIVYLVNVYPRKARR